MELKDYVIIVLKIIIGVSILNVWLLQSKKNTKWRGGNAKTIIEEFKLYGLSKSFCYIIGFLKISLALLLLASIAFEFLTLIATIGLSILLLGSIIMHIKIKDELYKSFPASLFLVLNLIVIFLSI
ncbi:DoxX family protein [uncultured Polaribacter sp.]|uniref:DoxX family protein n=1 Tax=uncultured Polaribacter sp. TaxID=174711 RepID=UPI00260E341E|nr:DoxX family protein [uncultured Polaribacter sp.]